MALFLPPEIDVCRAPVRVAQSLVFATDRPAPERQLGKGHDIPFVQVMEEISAFGSEFQGSQIEEKAGQGG